MAIHGNPLAYSDHSNYYHGFCIIFALASGFSSYDHRKLSVAHLVQRYAGNLAEPMQIPTKSFFRAWNVQPLAMDKVWQSATALRLT